VVVAVVVVAADVVTKPTPPNSQLSRRFVLPLTAEKSMLTTAEQSVLKVFRQFLIGQGEMLCFQGPLWEKHKTSLRQLTERDYLFQESFKGGYSLTKAGFVAMKTMTAA